MKNKNVNEKLTQERIVAGVALVSFVGCLAVPGNFFLDTTCAATWIAHGFWGVEAMIGDYVPLIAPAVVAGVSVFFHKRNIQKSLFL